MTMDGADSRQGRSEDHLASIRTEGHEKGLSYGRTTNSEEYLRLIVLTRAP